MPTRVICPACDTVSYLHEPLPFCPSCRAPLPADSALAVEARLAAEDAPMPALLRFGRYGTATLGGLLGVSSLVQLGRHLFGDGAGIAVWASAAGAYALTAGVGLLAVSEALRRNKPWSRHLVTGFLACFAGLIFTDIARSENVSAAVFTIVLFAIPVAPIGWYLYASPGVTRYYRALGLMARLELRHENSSEERPTPG